MKPKVFMAHPVYRMTDTGPVPKFPMGQVLRHGELVTVFGNSDMALMPDASVSYVETILRKHEFDPEVDLFLVAGDPTVYGLMLEASFVHYGARPQLLRWDRERREYDVLNSKLYNINLHKDDSRN